MFTILAIMLFINMCITIGLFIRQRTLLGFLVYIHSMIDDLYTACFNDSEDEQ